MDTIFPVNYQIHDLPVLGFTLDNIYTALTQNITGTIDEIVMPALQDPEFDLEHFAPLFTGDSWKVWDNDLQAYRPTKTLIGSTTITADPTANRLQIVQNKAGVVALLDDVYGIRDTVLVKEGLVSVDWDKGYHFRVVLGANRQTAFYMTHSKPGMEIDLLIVNSGTNQTVTWEAAIKWPAATAPTIPPSTAGAAKSMLVTLRNVNGTIYGDYTTAYEQKPVTDTAKVTGLVST